MDSDHLDDPLDRAVADRLAKLRTMPVDTSRLEARLRGQIPQPAAAGRRRFFLFGPLRMAAAGFIIVGIILAAVISSSGGPALASADRLAQIHEEVSAGHSRMMVEVSSLKAAGIALSQQWPKGPAMPDMPGDHVMSCCVQEMGRKKMNCVSLTVDNVPITMAVADSADVKVPEGTTITRDGVTFHVESCKGVNMAMTQRGGRWVCLMGKLPVDRLIDVQGQLRF